MSHAAEPQNRWLASIANYVLWPRMLLADWSPAPADIDHAVDEAVTTMLARYGRSANDRQQP
ncbi:TetR/AcrR family transcriptional regulator C-terminal domain-containing protein [Streptomyces sp. WM6378]|uniref:TetR/AcrR family transcriptional regulator C-terminal domain-containing protein n=1 Tax=Streptomyces sp. WM6378 TaxID=1415557 RepID=UPI0006AFF360|nr:TetR/AcrR family transcriptional regulator C-terminal domain-containing protein [Streptomyces sp. WM6378]KOU53558.1 hypothetical protein ADK54_04230 [Streptomyces sp. WM6378]